MSIWIVQGRRERSSCYAKIATWLETVELILYIVTASGHSKESGTPVRTKTRRKNKKKPKQFKNSPTHRRNAFRRLSKSHNQGSSYSLLCTTFSKKSTVCFNKRHFADVHRIQHISVPYLIKKYQSVSFVSFSTIIYHQNIDRWKNLLPTFLRITQYQCAAPNVKSTIKKKT